MCRRQGSALLTPGRQAERNCALPGFDRRTWTGERLFKIHMGAPRRYDREGVDGDWAKPHEPVDTDGCPGSWYRTPFVASVLRYSRRSDGNGGRVPNRYLDLCDDDLVIEAVEVLEGAEDAWRDEWLTQRMRKAQEGAGHG